jgi:hypothetical protein
VILAFPAGVLCLVAFSQNPGTSVMAESVAGNEIVPVAMTTFRREKQTRVLSVWKKKLVPGGKVTRLRDDRTVADTAFLVVDSEPTTPRQGRIVEVFYGVTEFGPLRCDFDVVWHPLRKEAYVIHTRSDSAEATFSVFRLELDKNQGEVPLSFDLNKKNEWPVEPKALSSWVVRFPRPGYPGWLRNQGIGIVRGIAEGDQLILSAERWDNRLSALFVRYHVVTKKWTQLAPEWLEE